MKVAILTQPLGRNYGGILQAYALQTYLKRMGVEVETLDRKANVDKLLSLKAYLRNLVKLCLGRIKSIPTEKKHDSVMSSLAAFRDQYIDMSQPIRNERELRNYFSGKKVDAFIVGSDQVWRPRYSPSILNYYLDFVDDLGFSPKRIAYAASFGVSNWEYDDNTSRQCKNLISKFDAVSVREESAVALCESHLGIGASWVVDPTLLLEREDYERLVSAGRDQGCPASVLSYVLDPEQSKQTVSDKVASNLNVKTFTIKPSLSISQVNARDRYKCNYPGVDSWIKSFRDALFVVTDSFHGTVFCIIFNKPFLVIGNRKRGMARFESLLAQFGLEERLIEDESQVSRALIQSEINWSAVNERREALAKVGRDFLNKNLVDD